MAESLRQGWLRITHECPFPRNTQDPASNPDSKAWKRVKESFSNYTGVDIGDDGCNHLYLGVQAGIKVGIVRMVGGAALVTHSLRTLTRDNAVAKALGDLMLTTPTVFEDVKSQVEHMLRSDGVLLFLRQLGLRLLPEQPVDNYTPAMWRVTAIPLTRTCARLCRTRLGWPEAH